MTTKAQVTTQVNYAHTVGSATANNTGTITSTGISNLYVPSTTVPYNSGIGIYNDAVNTYYPSVISTTFTDAVTKGGFPVHNLIETSDSFIVELALAGWKKKDLKIEVSDKDLLVSGENSHQHLSPEGAYLQRGVTRSQFNKTIALGPNIDQDKIEAKYEDGLLTVTVQKKIKIKTVPIKVSIK